MWYRRALPYSLGLARGKKTACAVLAARTLSNSQVAAGRMIEIVLEDTAEGALVAAGRMTVPSAPALELEQVEGSRCTAYRCVVDTDS